ncbi:UTRA domain-containing protein [Neobacillus endophyticus]|uniref:UTRA domain-containing protein n=1 Tax=Neobacillus endophyticus TaxID=2738405 RepID=UPI0028ADF057|nr:UTRA domain-containing protein [Neobacillus endophyticus]
MEYLEIVTADKEVADSLKIAAGSPCFSLETYAHTADEKIIEYSKTIFRGDMAHFVIERNY